MIEQTIYVRKSRADVVRHINDTPQATQVGLLAATAVLARIRQAFLAKSRGGTDETGLRWAPLARSTIERRLRKREPTTVRPSSALDTAQSEKWWGLYRRALAYTHDKSTAARIAWHQLKRGGGSSLFDKYGAAGIQILRDTDALYESLTPGAEHNVLRVDIGVAEFGSSRPGASAHHYGAKNLPRRRLWPAPDAWTPEWWQDVLSGARSGVVQYLAETL